MDVYKYVYKEVHKPHKIKRPTNRRPWAGAEGGRWLNLYKDPTLALACHAPLVTAPGSCTEHKRGQQAYEEKGHEVWSQRVQIPTWMHHVLALGPWAS